MKKILLLIILLAASGLLAGEQGHVYFTDGNAAYEAGDFKLAKDSYEKALNEGVVSSELYYNYANALFRLKKLGESILSYEKALKLAPTDKDIQANLKFANAQTIDKHPAPNYNLFTKIIWGLHSGYNLNHALWAMLILFSVIFILAMLSLFLSPGLKLFTRVFIVLCLVPLVVIAPSAILRIKAQETSRFSIVLSPVLELYSGPGDGYQVLSRVHEGTKFEIEKITGDWAKVKLPNGKGGYVKITGLGMI
ncbi:MAG: tetratricopeptide repeat protein [Fibrobacteria bacterium]|nr:tetratricopeptide repeat protein [Fibrobacteria bacterium]